MRVWSVGAAAFVLLILGGCSAQTSNIGPSETDQAFPKHSQAEVEAEIRKDPKAWAQYQAAKSRDAAVEGHRH